jgi:hypothetical protein
MDDNPHRNPATDSDANRCAVSPLDVDTRRRPPACREGVEFDDWIAEWVRRSTVAQGLPEFVEDPAVGDAVARIMLDD